MKISVRLFIGALLVGMAQIAQAAAEPSEIYCTIRETGSSLACQWLTKEGRKTMGPDDISSYIDAGQGVAFLTLKSRRGLERTFMIDGAAPQYKKLNETKRTASISEINKAKSELFNEIEKRSIKLSDELDARAAAAELVKYDSSIANDKFKREAHAMTEELDGYRKNRDRVCNSTPAFEQMSKANASLQQSLSNILYAFQTPDTCMSDFKVFKDKDGSVDLRQIEGVGKKFVEQCKKK